MVSLWQAPRIAYELEASWARTAGHRGPGDPLPPVPKPFPDLRPVDQHDVLEALSGHARVAAGFLAAQPGGGEVNVDAVIDAAGGADLCQQSRLALWTLLAAVPAPWQLPQCGHCTAIIATVLIAASHATYLAAGFSGRHVEAACRDAAGRNPPPAAMIPNPGALR